jgi:hypothetical protein
LKKIWRSIPQTVAAFCAAAFTSTGTGFAADAPEDKWQFSATLPIWAAGIEGDVTVRGVKSDIDIGFGDLVDHLDASFALALEARKGKFGLYAGGSYMKFSADGRGARGVTGDAELKFFIGEAGMSYRLFKTDGAHPFILEATAGMRYWAIDTDLKLTGPGGTVLVDHENKKELYDPVFGLRASKYLNAKWHLDMEGDIGGFGISDDSSDLSWGAAGLVSYDAARWITLSAGYKALTVETSEGSGAKKNGADIIMHGLLITAKLTF